MFWDYVLFFSLVILEVTIFVIVSSALDYSTKLKANKWLIYGIPFVCLVIALILTIEFVLK